MSRRVGTVWIGTSWKMNKTLAEARAWAAGLTAAIAERPELTRGVQPFVIPPFTALTTVREALMSAGAGALVHMGAQNAHWEDAGAWTGEVSVPQVADAGASLVEIGHSERREHFAETVETTRLKVAATLRHGLTPLLCIGEPLEVRDRGGSTEYILDQARGALDGVTERRLPDVLLAYEPIWAIGEHGRPATEEDLAEPMAALQAEYGGRVRAVLYGGSVSTDNAAGLLAIPGVDGLFVGRAAWQLDGFLRLLEIATAPPATGAGRT